jgi:uncharacterized protein YqeY
MATLVESIRSDMTEAMRAGKVLRRDTLRLLIAALGNARIASGHELNDDDAIVTLQREAKQRRESIEEYRKGDRGDLVESEEQELLIIQAYLPEELSEEELRSIVQEVITEVGASRLDDLGSVMGPVMQRVRGRADGRQANAIVRELLADD